MTTMTACSAPRQLGRPGNSRRAQIVAQGLGVMFWAILVFASTL